VTDDSPGQPCRRQPSWGARARLSGPVWRDSSAHSRGACPTWSTAPCSATPLSAHRSPSLL